MPSIKGFKIKNGQMTPETIKKLRETGVSILNSALKEETND